jgi:hypothetical protein
MLVYETAGSDDSFSYRLQYSRRGQGWALELLEVMRDGESVLSQPGAMFLYPTQALAIAYGINTCESIASRLVAGRPSRGESLRAQARSP